MTPETRSLRLPEIIRKGTAPCCAPFPKRQLLPEPGQTSCEMLGVLKISPGPPRPAKHNSAARCTPRELLSSCYASTNACPASIGFSALRMFVQLCCLSEATSPLGCSFQESSLCFGLQSVGHHDALRRHCHALFALSWAAARFRTGVACAVLAWHFLQPAAPEVRTSHARPALHIDQRSLSRHSSPC